MTVWHTAGSCKWSFWGISRNTHYHHFVHPVPVYINHFIALIPELDVIAGPGDPVQDKVSG